MKKGNKKCTAQRGKEREYSSDRVGAIGIRKKEVLDIVQDILISSSGFSTGLG